MPKLNKTIIRSIIQDLKSLEKICVELQKHVQNIKSMSWRYPPQMCHAVNIHSILRNFEGSSYECYLLILELLYDRFQYFLHLTIKYLDTIPLDSRFDSPRNVVNPEYLSAGALLNMLWIRFQILQKYIAGNAAYNAKSEGNKATESFTLSLGALMSQSVSDPAQISYASQLFNRSTQTEEVSLTNCENCCISESIVKLIINEMQTHCLECGIQSDLSWKRDNMKHELSRTTQWGAMMNWSNSIQNDLKELFQEISKQVKNNLKIQNILDERQKQIEEISKNKDDKILTLQKNVQDLHLQINNVTSRVNDLQKERNELQSKVELQTEEIHKLCEDLNYTENCHNEDLHRISFLETELKNMASVIGVNITCMDDYKNILEKWQSFISIIDHEKNCLRNELESQINNLQQYESMHQNEIEKKDTTIKENEEKLTNASLEISKLREEVSDCQELKNRLEQLQLCLNKEEQRSISLQKIVDELKQEIEQMRAKEKLLIENPDISTKIEIKVQGNPEQDMENQIQANEIRIQLLSQQTTKLRETLDKFRRITKFSKNSVK